MPSPYFPDEGPVLDYRCPECGLVHILCTLAAYEFTTLECQACGQSACLDDYQIEAWFAVGDTKKSEGDGAG